MSEGEVIEAEALRSPRKSAPAARGEVLAGPERRRRWSVEEKLRILAQSVAPGASATLVCRLHGISSGQLYTWRKQFRTGELTGFVPVAVLPEATASLPAPERPSGPPPGSAKRGGMIEVELASGVRLRVGSDVDEAALRRVLSALSPS